MAHYLFGETTKLTRRTTMKPILCLDFDGVIHSYSSGWQGPGIISDAPVPGAFEFIHQSLRHFDVQVFSARSGLPMGIETMKKWFIQNGWPESSPDTPEKIKFPTTKPPACVSLDDRAITFTGNWPELGDLRKFTPWNGSAV